MKRRNFLSGLMAGLLWLKTRFLAVKTKFFGPKAPQSPQYVVVPDESQPQIVELPDGNFLFPGGQIVPREAMEEAVKRLLPK